MRRTLGAVLVVVGMAIGSTAAALLVPDSVVSAQTSWQCKSWTFQKGREQAPGLGGQQEDVAAVGTWLGQARNVQITSAGLEVAGLYSLVACKQ